MALSHKYVGPNIATNINVYILTRAELLCSLCYEIPCINEIKLTVSSNLDMIFSKLQEFCKNKHCQYKNKTRMDSNGYWIPIIFFSLTFAFWLIVVLIIYFDTHAFDSSRDSCYRNYKCSKSLPGKLSFIPVSKALSSLIYVGLGAGWMLKGWKYLMKRQSFTFFCGSILVSNIYSKLFCKVSSLGVVALWEDYWDIPTNRGPSNRFVICSSF